MSGKLLGEIAFATIVFISVAVVQGYYEGRGPDVLGRYVVGGFIFGPLFGVFLHAVWNRQHQADEETMAAATSWQRIRLVALGMFGLNVFLMSLVALTTDEPRFVLLGLLVGTGVSAVWILLWQMAREYMEGRGWRW